LENPYIRMNKHKRGSSERMNILLKRAASCHVILIGGSRLSESLLIGWNSTISAHC
jgi:hypothetical protein